MNFRKNIEKLLDWCVCYILVVYEKDKSVLNTKQASWDNVRDGRFDENVTV